MAEVLAVVVMLLVLVVIVVVITCGFILSFMMHMRRLREQQGLSRDFFVWHRVACSYPWVQPTREQNQVYYTAEPSFNPVTHWITCAAEGGGGP